MFQEELLILKKTKKNVSKISNINIFGPIVEEDLVIFYFKFVSWWFFS